MDVMGLLIYLAIGALAGYLAGMIMQTGYGLLGNVVIGVIGAVIGGHLLGVLDIAMAGLIGSTITATAGALLLLFIVGLVKKRS